jgi:hypothetical protein
MKIRQRFSYVTYLVLFIAELHKKAELKRHINLLELENTFQTHGRAIRVV